MSATVGLRVTEFDDRAQGVRIPLALLYPSKAAESPERFGPYAVAAARDAPAEGAELPLAVISHGRSGTPWTHRDLAKSLARAGYVVAAPEHIGNSRSDNSLAGTAANLENRPRHVTLAIDAALADPVVGPRIAAGRVAVIGHSIGGYTALAAAGGRPYAGPHETSDGAARPVPVAADPRIKAAVLLAPALFWFDVDGALGDVAVPILVRSGACDEVTPPEHARIVERGVPDPALVEHRVVPRAGHFSFQSPFPAVLQRPDFPPSQDPEGFDRAGYQPQLADEITGFLHRVL